MVISCSTVSLVAPGTISQDSNQSLSFTSRQHKARQHATHSKFVLTLIALCMFLTIICGCLIVVLVLVGRSLSTSTMTASEHSQLRQTHTSKHTMITAITPIIHSSIENIETKIVLSTSERKIATTTEAIVSDSNGSNKIELEIPETSTDMNLSVTSTMRSMDIIKQLGWRLPAGIHPTMYNLTLRPNFQTRMFEGSVSIYLNVSKPISFVAVHSKKLSVVTESLLKNVPSGDINVEIANTFEYPEKEYWVTELARPSDAGEYILNLSFGGKLTDRIVGFYQSSYFDVKTNETR